MGKGLPRSLKHSDMNNVRVMTVPINHTISVTGDAGAANDGQAVIGGFPEGNIFMVGALINVTFSGPGGNDDLADTWEGDFGVGTAPDSNSTLAGTDVDIIGSTAIAAATAEVSPAQRVTNVTPVMFDNTDGSLEINLNFLIDDADLADDAEVDITAEGALYIAYAVMGDD